MAEVVDFVRNSGGLDYARSKMEGHLQKAADILSNFPKSAERTALEEVIAYTGAVRSKPNRLHHGRNYWSLYGDDHRKCPSMGEARVVALLILWIGMRVVRIILKGLRKQ